MGEHNHRTEIRELLAARRDQLPSEVYFDGFLDQFHNYQRANMLNERRGFFGQLRDWFEAGSLTFPIRAAVPAAAACVLFVFGVFTQFTTTSAPTVNFSMAPASEESFLAFSDE